MPEHSRNQIISELLTGKNFNDFVSKIEPSHLREDLKQEVAVIICSWSDEKIIGLEERGELSFYVVRMVFNMVTNKYHPFHKKYRSINVEFKELLSDPYFNAVENDEEYFEPCRLNHKEQSDDPEVFRDVERECREQMEDETMEQIGELPWYSAELIKLYMEVGTYRAMQRVTGIPYISCYKTIQKSFEILREKAKAPKPLFTKTELKFIQDGKNETGD